MTKIRESRLVAASMTAGMFLLSCAFAFAQGNTSQAAAKPTSSIDQDISMLRKDIRSQRKQLIAANMNLTGDEAEKFWPIYDQYVGELVQINNTKYDLIKQFVQSSGSLTAEQADNSVKQWLGVDESVAQLRMKYVPIFRKVLSPQNTALFYQLDRRVQLMIDLQLASQLPLVEP
jgi:Spy/CpxP family protein refolding chaperone